VRTQYGAEKLAALRTEAYFRERAARSDIPGALKVLERMLSITPLFAVIGCLYLLKRKAALKGGDPPKWGSRPCARSLIPRQGCASSRGLLEDLFSGHGKGKETAWMVNHDPVSETDSMLFTSTRMYSAIS
jgi:hypothetical protein